MTTVWPPRPERAAGGEWRFLRSSPFEIEQIEKVTDRGAIERNVRVVTFYDRVGEVVTAAVGNGA